MVVRKPLPPDSVVNNLPYPSTPLEQNPWEDGTHNNELPEPLLPGVKQDQTGDFQREGTLPPALKPGAEMTPLSTTPEDLGVPTSPQQPVHTFQSNNPFRAAVPTTSPEPELKQDETLVHTIANLSLEENSVSHVTSHSPFQTDLRGQNSTSQQEVGLGPTVALPSHPSNLQDPFELQSNAVAWEGTEPQTQAQSNETAKGNPSLLTPNPDHDIPSYSQSVSSSNGTPALERPFENTPPELPPRTPTDEPDHEKTPEQLPRPQIMTRVPQVDRGETYQIRHINWYDMFVRKMRESPILVQNANGPCPLLALVNALLLSTHMTASTPLVETLRVREHVTLGLLLEAVFNELYDRCQSTVPDPDELNAFLVALHTGMNVNPAFVAPEPDSLIALPSEDNTNRVPGGFENTKEMGLYSLFGIPLVHGWLPPHSHPVYQALERLAKTYEDAQNILFHEEELEDKLDQERLSEEELEMLQDIKNIKQFLSTTATQLTGFGLDLLTDTLAPGTFAILFRNDHFSTICKHPSKGQLLTLVTDAGYAGHDEIVWQSLVDVNGEGSEFFSGDFRPVGNAPNSPTREVGEVRNASDEDWTTVSRGKRSSQRQQLTINPHHTGSNSLDVPLSSAKSPSREQEDHDFALALQLQEDEEERERSERAARQQRDSRLNEYAGNRQSNNNVRVTTTPRPQQQPRVRPLVPPRNQRPRRTNPAVNRPPSPGAEAPPPSYEQATASKVFIPGPNHPAHPSAVPPGIGGGNSAYYENSGASTSTPSFNSNYSGRRRSTLRGGGSPMTHGNGQRKSSVNLSEERREKDCIVM
ncbi:MAG: hypothetical protein M1834_005831 [Cirrosporium novae-zelandiae]|nr:MAG: hypothetical protein M1834_005831 [Cirrosporium novae-zelandiae]